MNIQQLSEMLGQSESDTQAFVNCLAVWTNKGHTIEQAIELHMTQMTRLANNATALPKSLAVDAFFGG